MYFVNLTPHAIVLNDGRRFEPSGQIARVSSVHSPFDANGIAEVSFGDIVGLPEPAHGTTLIVSALVATAAVDRFDLVSPATGHPDARRENGQIVSVPGFVRP